MLVASRRNQLYLDHEVAGIWRPFAVSGRAQHSCEIALQRDFQAVPIGLEQDGFDQCANGTRGLEDSEEVTVAETVSGADSVRVRVHLYERCFRRKPVKRVPADDVHAGVTHDTGDALHDDTHRARFYRTTVTCIWA